MYNFAAYLLFPFGLLNGVQHVQMTYERVVVKNQLWNSPIMGACVAFQASYSALLLRWSGLVKSTGVENANLMANAAYLHIGVFVIVNIIRLYFLSENDFDAKKMTENYIQPTCPLRKKAS